MRHLIHHHGARTRALYAWETETVFMDKRNVRFDQKTADKFARDFWEWRGRKDCKPPVIKITCLGDISFCDGRSDIVMHIQDTGPVILLHELVHARGFGTESKMHPVSFVRYYIECLSLFLGFDEEYLRASAMMRGLV